MIIFSIESSPVSTIIYSWTKTGILEADMKYKIISFTSYAFRYLISLFRAGACREQRERVSLIMSLFCHPDS